MPFNFAKYVKLWPFTQFVGLELVAGGMISERWHGNLGQVVALAGLLASAYAFAYVTYKDGLRSLLNIRRLLQAAGYAAIIVGMLPQVGSERGAAIAFVGTGVAMAGFCYDLIYP